MMGFCAKTARRAKVDLVDRFYAEHGMENGGKKGREKGQKNHRRFAAGNAGKNQNRNRNPGQHGNRPDDFEYRKGVITKRALPPHEQTKRHTQNGRPEELLEHAPDAPEYVHVVCGRVDRDAESGRRRRELLPDRYGARQLVETRYVEELRQQIPGEHERGDAQESEIWRRLRKPLTQAKERQCQAADVCCLGRPALRRRFDGGHCECPSRRRAYARAASILHAKRSFWGLRNSEWLDHPDWNGLAFALCNADRD